MVLSVTWRMDGTEEASERLNQWETRLRHPEAAFDEIMDHIASEQKDYFKKNAKAGGDWAPLSEPYRKWKRKKFPKRGILHGPDRPGHKGLQLRDQLTKRPFGFEMVTPRGFELGTEGLPYAQAHQLGLGRLPARPPLKGIDAKTLGVIQRIWQMHVVGDILERNSR